MLGVVVDEPKDGVQEGLEGVEAVAVLVIQQGKRGDLRLFQPTSAAGERRRHRSARTEQANRRHPPPSSHSHGFRAQFHFKMKKIRDFWMKTR